MIPHLYEHLEAIIACIWIGILSAGLVTFCLCWWLGVQEDKRRARQKEGGGP